MAETLADKISDNAAAPLKVEVDGESAQQHKLTDQIEADKYLRNVAAGKRRASPIRLGKFIPGGAV